LAVAGGVWVWLDATTTVSSGSNWELISESIDTERTPGELVIDKVTDDGITLSMVVATDTGGSTECDDPSLHDYELDRADNYFFEFRWPGRDCADRGGLVVTVFLDDIPDDGVSVSYKPSPEAPSCPRILLLPDGEILNEEDVDCPDGG